METMEGDELRIRRLHSAANRATGFALIVVADDSEFAARYAQQLPVGDLHAVESGCRHRAVSASSHSDKHWGCDGPLIIDARIKPHHAPPLEDDPAVAKRVDALGAPGGPLHGII